MNAVEKLIAIVTMGVVTGALLTATLSADQRKDECREGTGDLGIGEYVCEGGDCEVSVHLKDGRVVHRFSVEPRIASLYPKGPSAGKLQENDVLVAAGGSLVTTLEGGYKLANARIGVPIVLRVRRGKSELEIQIVPAKGCNLPNLTVRK